MELIYATKNRAKLQLMRSFLQSVPITLLGLDEIDPLLPDAVEDGTTPYANACIKAAFYFRLLKRPLFSGDSGLFIEGLPPQYQPGAHVRTPHGSRMDDEQTIAHYASLIHTHGGKLRAYYINAICLYDAQGNQYVSDDKSLWTTPFILCDTPHPSRRKGLPLDSLSKDIQTGKYFFDLPAQQDLCAGMENAYAELMTRWLGL